MEDRPLEVKMANLDIVWIQDNGNLQEIGRGTMNLWDYQEYCKETERIAELDFVDEVEGTPVENPLNPTHTPILGYTIKITPTEGLIERRKKEIKKQMQEKMKKSIQNKVKETQNETTKPSPSNADLLQKQALEEKEKQLGREIEKLELEIITKGKQYDEAQVEQEKTVNDLKDALAKNQDEIDRL